MTVETFKIKVLPMKHKLFRLANRMLINVPEAEDIVQEVFLRLWARKDRLNEYRSIEAFAMTITNIFRILTDNLVTFVTNFIGDNLIYPPVFHGRN